MIENTHELERFLDSRAYAIFGFGTDPIDFAKHLMNLSKENPAEYELLHDITDRISFVDRVLFTDKLNTATRPKARG